MDIDNRPFKIYSDKRGWPRWFQPLYEAWLVLTQRCSLHRAWQAGFDAGNASEYKRLIVNKAYLGEVEAREKRLAYERAIGNQIQNQFGYWRA